MVKKTVAVIGGGLGSLSAAIRLARMGFTVKLFEQNSQLGGKMSEYKDRGFRWDTGPSLLTMPWIVDELFDFVGLNVSDYLSLTTLEPLCRYFFSDQTHLEVSANKEKMRAALDSFSPTQSASYFNFLHYASKIYDAAAEVFLYHPIHELRKLLTPANIQYLMRFYHIDPWRTMHQSVSRFFTDQRLIQLFDRFATYNGSNPFTAPATLNIISFVENGMGGYYIKGGMYRLIETLEKVAIHLGVEVHPSCKVNKIKHDHHRINGLLVQDEFFPADFVLCGADVVETFNTLVSGFNRYQKKLNTLEPSLSGLVFLWGMNKSFPILSHHNILFSADYAEEFRYLFSDLKVPDDPTIYIAITSKSDANHAPANSENWFVLLNMPYLAPGQNWDSEKDKIRETVLQKLKRFGLDVSQNIQSEKCITPQDFYTLYGSNRGSIYGLSSNSRMMAFRRPANRSRLIQGLYFAGGSVHPGGGIPLVLLSGKMAAELIAEHAGISLDKFPRASLETIRIQKYPYSQDNRHFSTN